MLGTMANRTGDKIRVKSGPAQGAKGVITEVAGDVCRFSPVAGGRPITINLSEIVNYSLAARKAWEKMPERKVGRPVGSVRTDRVSVTFRIDRALWHAFLKIEREGTLPERNVLIDQAIEHCLHEAKRTSLKRGNQ